MRMLAQEHVPPPGEMGGKLRVRGRGFGIEEAAGGRADVHIHPLEGRTARLTFEKRFIDPRW